MLLGLGEHSAPAAREERVCVLFVRGARGSLWRQKADVVAWAGDWSQEDTEGFGGDGNVLKPGAGAGAGCTTEAYT